MQTIARLDAETRQWSNAGSLFNPRYDNAAIFDGTRFLVIGGGGSKNIEVCDLRKVLRNFTDKGVTPVFDHLKLITLK